MEMKTEDTPVRCDGMEEDGAPFSSPYRHYARVRWAPRNSHAHYPAARWGHRALPPLHPREVRRPFAVVWCCGFAAGEGDRTPRPARLLGAHGDAPGKTLSVCYRHYTPPLHPRITRHVPWCGPIAMTPSCCGNKTMIYSTSTMPRHLGYLQQPKNFLPVSREVRSTMALPHRGQSGASVSDTGLCVLLRLFTCADTF